MADVKRLNYFTSQFLVEKDFKDEQAYLVEMRRRHNQLLHTWGVADGGLQVSKSSDKIVIVGAGMAVDKEGQEMVLLDAQSKDLSGFGSNADVYLTLKYQEVSDPADHYTSGGVDNYTRITERPSLDASTTVPATDGSAIVLAKVSLDGSGNVGKVDVTVRRLAGSAIDPTTDIVVRSLSVTGNANVGGSVGIGTSNPPQQLSITGGIGFANQNAADKKLYSPADGTLEWMTNDGAAQHGFAVSHQGQQRVFLSTNGNSYLNGGNLGIGTTTPGAGLEIQKGTTNDLALLLNSSGPGWGSGLQLRNTAKGGKTFGIYSGFGSLHITDQDAGVDRLVIDPSGNVGIGTPSIGFKLDVGDRMRVRQGASGSTAGIWFYQTGPNADRAFVGMVTDTEVGLWGNTGATWGLTMDTTTSAVKLLASSNPVYFTQGHSGFSNKVTNVSEIANDVGTYKTLLITGNQSAGLGRRVTVTDRFEVNGTFVNNSSIEVKQDVRTLSEEDYKDIHNKLMKTPIFRYRFKAAGIDQKLRMGVISEESPSEILDETGKYVSFLDYVGFLFAALKVQGKELDRLATLIGA